MRSFAFRPGLSHALHQVRKQGCPSSPALSSPRGVSRQEIADIPHFAAPPGDAHRARGSLIFAPPQHAGCNTSANLSCSGSSYCAGFNRNRCVTLAPKPTWKSVSLTHILCRIPASLRATATIAHSMLDRWAIRRPQARNAEHLRNLPRKMPKGQGKKRQLKAGMHVEAMNGSDMGHAEYAAALGLSPRCASGAIAWKDPATKWTGDRCFIRVPEAQ